MKKRVFLILIYVMVCFPCYFIVAEEIDLVVEYKILLNDLKNRNTVGYKSHFSLTESKGIQSKNMSQGSLRVTDCNTDLGVMGNGYFKLQNREGDIVYTRNGEFNIDSSMELKHVLGFSLIDKIVFPTMYKKIKVNRNGTVSIIDNTDQELFVGMINLYDFIIDDNSITKDEIYYLQKNDVKKIDNIKYGQIIQKTIEVSNVDIAKTILRLIFILNTSDLQAIQQKELKSKLLYDLLHRVLYEDYILKTQHAIFSGKITVDGLSIGKWESKYLDSDDDPINDIFSFLGSEYK